MYNCNNSCFILIIVFLFLYMFVAVHMQIHMHVCVCVGGGGGLHHLLLQEGHLCLTPLYITYNMLVLTMQDSLIVCMSVCL